MIYQVTDTLKKITVPFLRENRPDRIQNEHIPTKRHDAKERGVDDKYIFSEGTYRTYRDAAITCTKWLKEKYQIKELSEITPEMLKKYYDYRKETCSAWTVKKDYSAMTKLSTATKSRNWIQKDFQVPIDEVDLPDRELSDRNDRGPFSSQEAEKIVEGVKERSEVAGKYVEFILETGARLKGAFSLKEDDVYIGKDGSFRVRLNEKGGKIRSVKISESYYQKLQKISKENQGDYVFPKMTKSNIDNLVKEVAKENDIINRKPHGLRGTAANRMKKKLLSNGIPEEKVKKLVSNFLGHNRKGVFRFYDEEKSS